MIKKVLVISPTYNEKSNIAELIAHILKLSYPLDILIVDDNSPDGTANIVKRIIKDNENKTPEEIEEISNIKERDLLLRLTSDDLEERLKIIERLKKELEINDKEIFKIVQKLIENARKKEQEKAWTFHLN